MPGRFVCFGKNARNGKVSGMKQKTDVLIVGTGASGLFCALQLPETLQVCMISKQDIENSDSYLAQGGISTLKDEGRI